VRVTGPSDALSGAGAGTGLECRLVTRERLPRAGSLPVLGAVAVVLLTGCSGQGNAEVGNAQAAAVSFSHAVGDATAAACDLLAPETRKELEDSEGPCASSLSEQLDPASGTATSAEVYGKDAIVHLPTDTVFLARFHDGWRVTAAGCTRSEVGRPYDCIVKGG
jgi:hypothetical protein